MRPEILTAETLEAMNAQEIYQLLQEHSLDEFSELERRYKGEAEKLLNEVPDKKLTYGQKMLRFEAINENHRRANVMHGFCQLKSINATMEQIDENLKYWEKLKEEMENYEAEVFGREEGEGSKE